MSVLYDFMPLPSKENDENAPRLYPKLIPYQTVSFNELTQKMPLPSKENDENAPRLYPKLIPYQTVSFNELTQKIVAHSGLTKGNVLAVMDEIEHWATQLLSEGRRVQIGNIGTLSVSLKADTEVYDKSKVRPPIRKKNAWLCSSRTWRPTITSPAPNTETSPDS